MTSGIGPGSATRGTLLFDANLDANAADPIRAYRESHGGIQGWGRYAVVDDPMRVVEPGRSAVRKVLKLMVDGSDYGDSACPPRSRLQFQVGNHLGARHNMRLSFGSQYYMSGSLLLPRDLPARFPNPQEWMLTMGTFSPPFAGSSPAHGAKFGLIPGGRLGIAGDKRLHIGLDHSWSLFPIKRGVWYDWVMWHKASSGANVPDGAQKVWFNDGDGWRLIWQANNIVTVNDSMRDGELVHYFPKLYYPAPLTSTVPLTSTCNGATRTYAPEDPTGAYGWKGRTVTVWASSFKIGTTFGIVQPHTYDRSRAPSGASGPGSADGDIEQSAVRPALRAGRWARRARTLQPAGCRRRKRDLTRDAGQETMAPNSQGSFYRSVIGAGGRQTACKRRAQRVT